MKQIVAIILLFLVAAGAAAQELTVKRLEAAPMDLSAATESRRDNNGAACALLKVQIPLEGMVFEGNVIGDCRFRGGEYWVYLTAGTKGLNVKHNTLTPKFIRFADYGVPSLEGKTTYVLQLLAPQSSGAAATKETVVFKISPKEATLFVDDAEYDLVGGQAQIPLTCGTHKCSIMASGYKAQTESFTVTPGANNKRVYELDPKQGATASTSTTTPSTPAAPTRTFDEIKAEADNAYDTRNYARALELYMQISEIRGVQNRIGYMYKNGKGVAIDYVEGVKWYRKAAEQGYAPAQHNLVFMYNRGLGVDKDKAEAVKWYRKAADQGHVSSQYNLGVMYERGQGVNKDYAEAVKWYRKAADQGHEKGRAYLGEMYYYGKGVAQDRTEAYKLMREAADKGLEYAKTFIKEHTF